MGGGNPISVAANFRLVFDTRSAARTATKYDAALASMANKGNQAMQGANVKLQQEHARLLLKVQKDNDIANETFKTRTDAIFNHVNRKSQQAFRDAKKAQLEAAKGPRGGTSSREYKEAEKAYTASIAAMDAANKKYVASVRALNLNAGGGIFDREAFGSMNIDERKLAIEATKEQIGLTEINSEQHQILTQWLEEQLLVDRQITAAEKDRNKVIRQGSYLIRQSAREMEMGMSKNNVKLREFKQNLMEANMQLNQMANTIKMGLTQALMTSAIVLVSFGFKLSRLTEQFREFEQELMNANSIWQESNEVLYQASDTIVEFSTQYGIALNDATEGLYQMASAGLEAAEAQAILKDTLLLSMAVQGDHETLSKLTIQTIKGFGLEMSDSAELTDKFAYAINMSLLEWQDLSSAVKFAMPFFVSTGQSVEQLLGALEILTNRALEAGIAGRGLRQALAQFAKHADDNTAAFRKMGIEILNNEGEFKQFTEIAKEFSDQFGQNINDTEMMTKLLEDLNVRGATAFIHLVQNADEFSHAVDDLANSQGAAKDMADIQNQSLDNQITVLKNAAAASFFMSDATYENLGAMNEFDYLLQTAVQDLREFLFVQTETGLILNETGENLKTLVNEVLKQFILLAREAYVVIAEFAASGNNLSGVIEALVLPLRLMVRILGRLGEGTLEAIVMFKIMNTVLPMNTLYMMANAQAQITLGSTTGTLQMQMAGLAASLALINAFWFAGFLLMSKQEEGYYALGNALIFLAGAMQVFALAKGLVDPVTLGIGMLVGGAAAVWFARMMTSAMTPPKMDYEPLEPLDPAEFSTTMDTGGRFMPRYMSYDGGGYTPEHGFAMLQKGETVKSKTQNMQSGGEQPIVINIQGDVYDADNFTEKIAEVLPRVAIEQENKGMMY